MSLTEEFKIELQKIRDSYSDRPELEYRSLLLMALEREQLVSMAYKEDNLFKSIENLKISSEQKKIIKKAVVWIWKDEQMHTTYVRSQLLALKQANPFLDIFSFQTAGAIGGWASSVIHHHNFRSSPISSVLARVFIFFGKLFGKVPKEASKNLKAGSFIDFCKFNRDAEITAKMCWHRIAELATQLNVESSIVESYQQITNDEDNHLKIFSLFIDSIKEANDETLDSALIQRIAEISPYFLPREYRNLGASPLKLPPVWCYSKQNDLDKVALFKKILEKAELISEIKLKAKSLAIPLDKINVVVKAPFMMIYDRADLSPVIDLELLKTLILFLKQNEIKNISLYERGNIYENFIENRRVPDVADYLELNTLGIPIIDGDADQVSHRYPRGLGLSHISQKWKDADFRISFGKLRSHPTDHVLLTIANLEGVGPRWDEFLFYNRSVDYSAAQATMISEFPADFALLDAYEKTPDGMIGVMGHKKARSVQRLYASKDPLLLDLAVLQHLNIPVRNCKSLNELFYWYGEAPEKIPVIGDDSKIKIWRGPHSNDICTLMSLLATVFYESTGKGKLFLPVFDKTKFSKRYKESILIGTMRSVVLFFLNIPMYLPRLFK